MLPSLRTMIPAMVLTAIFVSLIGIALTPAPGGSYVHSAEFPRLVRPTAQQALERNPNRQPFRVLDYARRADELNRLLMFCQSPTSTTVQLSSAVFDTFEDGTSLQPVTVPRLKPTPVRARVRHRMRVSPGSMAGTYTHPTTPRSSSDANTTSFNGTRHTVSTSERAFSVAPGTSAPTRDTGF